ncbi:NudC domain-containing protein 1 [Ameca splendens]|uniref:NudC domain-containing protein 1 n=1 Tax=Ameca splendens TaxID=208324 RepID=A0ABV0YTD7_9TELE
MHAWGEHANSMQRDPTPGFEPRAFLLQGCSATHGTMVLFSERMGEPFTILHSVSHVQAGVHAVEVLLLRVQKDPQETKGSGYSVFLEWITVGGAAGHGQERKYEVRKRRVLRGKSVPHYAAVEPQGKGLMVASEKPFVFTHVDGHPVEKPEPMEVEKTGLDLRMRDEM